MLREPVVALEDCDAVEFHDERWEQSSVSIGIGIAVVAVIICFSMWLGEKFEQLWHAFPHG